MSSPALLVPLLLSAAVSSSAPTRNERMTLYVGGSRAGTVTSTDEKTAGGWKLTRASQMEIRRGTQTLRLGSTSVCDVANDLTPRSFRYVRDEPSGQMTNEGTFTCTKTAAGSKCTARVKTSLGGAITENTLDLPAGATCAAAEELRARQQLVHGATRSASALIEELGVLASLSWNVEKEAGGFAVRSKLQTPMGAIESIDHLDAAGRTLKSEMPQLNAVALPEGSPAPDGSGNALDVLARSTWKGPRLPDEVKMVRFELTTSDGTLAPVPQDRRQKVLTAAAQRVVVEVRDQPTGKAELLTAEQRKTALAATPYEPLSDPRIVEAAKKARGNARTTKEVIRAVTMYVHHLVKTKSLARAYAPATATLESREGDCTEHSVLTSALLKANGIPARLADGVIAWEGNLGYHEWVEAYVDGEGWVPIDPTFGQPEAGPNRVKFITGSSDPSDLMAMGLSAAQAFKGLTVKVQSFEEK